MKKYFQILSLLGLMTVGANSLFAVTIIMPPTITEFFTSYTFSLDTHHMPDGSYGYDPGTGPNLYRLVLFEDSRITTNKSDGDVMVAFDQNDNVITTTEPFIGALPSQALMIGLVDNLPGDSPDLTTTHVVFLMSNPAAAIASGQAFASVFNAPLTGGAAALTEDQLITAIIQATNGQQAGIDALADFSNTTARNLAGASGTTSAWFDFSQPTGGAFSVVSFSDGRILGAGTTDFTSQEIANTQTPEPGTWLLLAAGLGTLAYYRRRI